MRIPRRTVALAVLAGTALAAVTGAGSAAATPATAPTLTQLPGDYITPLQFAVSGDRVYVADGARSALFRVGRATPIASGPAPSANPEQSGDLAGVDVHRGRIAYTTTEADHKHTFLTVLHHGHRVLQVDLGRYERRANPDGATDYGVTDTSKVTAACRKQLAGGEQPVPITYRGIKDSHPYAVAGLDDGSWLVADAGGNDIVRVDRWGRISTVAVLPAQPVTLTKALAAELKVKACEGLTYRFEAVPTDVEVRDGHVYVTTLPGGAGGLGSVYEVGWDGSSRQIATGFASATNLAVAPNGCIYVVELGRGVFTPGAGGPQQVVALKGAAAVEWADGHLYASTAPAAASEGAPGSTPPAPGHIYRIG
ncbi:ScyD/ScyE family protein [uncultured Amnibacterium sp.]|uniref:ScyD/ScyE family protein n=1 Tax=uncultured Amnibacterium sp. TaxID=1631851 RepID=UPI0035CB5E6E